MPRESDPVPFIGIVSVKMSSWGGGDKEMRVAKGGKGILLFSSIVLAVECVTVVDVGFW